MITWVIGSGGLLGSAVARRCGRRFTTDAVPWWDPDQARRVLYDQARQFEAQAGEGPWRVVWAAGAATTSTPRDDAMGELQPLTGVLEGLRSALPRGPGAFFLSSSAGSIYAGADGPPFDAETPPAPLSPYGELKLAQEALTTDLLGALVPVVLGRISNLYGPGQDLAKLQGLVSRLALAAVTRQPINIFVSLETIRDYIYVDDAARTLLDLADTAMGEPRRSRTVVIGSGQPATIGQLIRTMNEVAKRRVPVALGSHPSAGAQALDLRLVPTVAPTRVTPLAAGMKAVYLDVLDRTQRAALAG